MKYLDKIKPLALSLKDKITKKVDPILNSVKEKINTKLRRFSNESSSNSSTPSDPSLDLSSNSNSSSTSNVEASSLEPSVSADKTSGKSSDMLSNHLDTMETEDNEEENTEDLSSLRKKRIIRYLCYGCSFIVLFFIFFLMSFPYSILKETATRKLEEISGLSVSIKDASLALPVGIKLYDITFKSNDLNYTIKRVKVKLSFFSLLAMNLRVSVDIDDTKKGSISIIVKEGIFRLLFSKNKLPSLVKIQSKNFSLTEIISVFLSKLSSDSSMNPMIAPLLEEVYITGSLNTNINLDIASNPKNSNGSILIKLDSATLGLKDPSLNIPEQKFERASIKMNLKHGELVIDKDSKIESSDLSVEFEGKISLEENIAFSNVAVNIPIKLKGALFNSYGFMLGGGSGSSTLMITGTFNNISTYQK